MDGNTINDAPDNVTITCPGSLEVNYNFRCNRTLSQKGKIIVKPRKIAKFEAAP